MTPQRSSRSLQLPGFTLVELMVSVSIIGLIMAVLLGMTNQISTTWRNTTGKIEQYQQARNGFESMTRKLSQATLNTMWGLVYGLPVQGHVNPTAFTRQSQLRFVSGPMAVISPGIPNQSPTHGVFFQAPLGMVDTKGVVNMENLLNTWGYFIQFGDDSANNPSFLPASWPHRYGHRLMELMVPTEYMTVYNLDAGRHDAQTNKPPSYTSLTGQMGWFQTPLGAATSNTRVLAENIIALIVWPKLGKQDEDNRRNHSYSTLAPQYTYDSSTLIFSTNPANNATTLPTGPAFNLGVTVSNPNDPFEGGQISPKNQLPPVVQVTMVALDGASAARLLDGAGKSLLATYASYDAFTAGLFTRPYAGPIATTPGQPSQYDLDMATLEQRLSEPASTLSCPQLGAGPLHYRIFTTNVIIRGAKWSSYTTN